MTKNRLWKPVFLRAVLTLFSVLGISSMAHAAPGVASWGWNSNMLGNRGTADSSVPVYVDTSGILKGKTITDIEGGNSFTVSLASDGKVYCWGNGGFGDGTLTATPWPVAVDTSGFLKNKTVIAIAAGGSHGLALTSEGRICGWGDNKAGQLGDGTLNNSLVPKEIDDPELSASRTFAAIAAGYKHSVAVDSEGNVFAWGSNQNNQLGGSAQTTYSNIPVAVTLPTSVTAVACGAYHSLAIGADGKLYAWGDNTHGELGNGSSDSTSAPVVVSLPAGVAPVKIAAGYWHSIALASDGRLYAWGDNSRGQIGRSDLTPQGSLTPVTVDASGVLKGKTIIDLDAGWFSNIVATLDGGVATWGANNYGQIGDGTTTDRSTPVAPISTSVLKGATVKSVGAGWSNAFAVVEGPVTPGVVNISTPAKGAVLSSLTSIAGSMTPNVGFGASSNARVVNFTLRRSGDGLYWTGTIWGSRTLLPTTLNLNDWVSNGALPSGTDLRNGLYTIGAIARDYANDIVLGNSTFTVRNTTAAPTVSITTPGRSDVLRTLTRIIGRTADRSGSGIGRVEIVLKRERDGLYWNGTAWGRRAVLPTTILGDTWQFQEGLPEGAELPDGNYTIGAAAYDGFGSSAGATRTFAVDGTGPTHLAIINPPNGTVVTELPSIDGLVYDNEGGSGIASVGVVLRRDSDNLYWTGAAWGSRTVLPTIVSGSEWRVTADLPFYNDLVNGRYTMTITAYDVARHVVSIGSIFTLAAPALSADNPSPSTVVSPFGLSTGTASVNRIQLAFNGAVDADSATAVASYAISVDGQTVPVEAASLRSAAIIELHIPQGSIAYGSNVEVRYRLRDAQGRRLSGQIVITAK